MKQRGLYDPACCVMLSHRTCDQTALHGEDGTYCAAAHESTLADPESQPALTVSKEVVTQLRPERVIGHSNSYVALRHDNYVDCPA